MSWGLEEPPPPDVAREKQVNIRVVPTGHAIDESVELAHEIYIKVFRKVPDKLP